MQKLQLISTIAALALILGSCAKHGTPTGGSKDELPPKVENTNPENGMVHYVPGKKIEITFDEFIQLENVFQEFIISPPLKKRIIPGIKGKSVVVEFPKDVVFDTTTYTLNFGHSIVDNNEGNVLKNYKFAFSLKGYLDSMSIEGRVVNSFDHTPDEERMFVMLYKNLNDSAPFLDTSDYISRTDEEGYFRLYNLEAGKYRMFGLKDVNSNFLFDPGEQIAFADSVLELSPEQYDNSKVQMDSLFFKEIAEMDSVAMDSVTIDSLRKVQPAYTFYTEMVFFTEETENQYMTNNLRSMRERLFFSFNESLTDSFSITPLNYTTNPDWYILDARKNKDTLIFWLTDTSMINMDSLQFEVSYEVYDSIGELYTTRDTLMMKAPPEKEEVSGDDRKRKRKKEDDPDKNPEEELEWQTIFNNVNNSGSFGLNKNIVLSVTIPSFDIITEKIQLFRLQDTLEIPETIEVKKDQNSMYQYIISYQPEELTSYKLLIPDSAITNIYGITNDTTLITFKTRAEDSYGVLSLAMNNINQPVILQLLNENETLVHEQYLVADKKVRYEYLDPKTYLLKLIIDENNNKKWDTGDYLLKKQPERIVYFDQVINVRSNWEMEFNWDVSY